MLIGVVMTWICVICGYLLDCRVTPSLTVGLLPRDPAIAPGNDFTAEIGSSIHWINEPMINERVNHFTTKLCPYFP